ncbi:MAG: hypothetical protein JXR70_14515 [Spirochaetales bacterium]|nr:hypothetical protein [Spirochaetales bacterium]
MIYGQSKFYVAPDGSDTNPGTLEQPFLTLSAAQQAVRQVNSNMTADIHIILRGGNYEFQKAIVLTPADSGTNGYTVFYEAYPGEEPVLNGGEQVTGWTQHSGNIYKAQLVRNSKLRTLIVNEKRAFMARKTVTCQGSWGTYSIRAGQAEWAWVSGSKADGAKYSTNDVPLLENAEDVEIINSTTWNQNLVCVREISTEGNSRILKFQQPFAAIAMNQGWNAGFATSGSHFIQNAYEFLDSPGEFYFNKSTSTLYYYRDGENMSTAEVYAPKLETLIEISGTSLTNRVKNITFKGITFANTEAELPMVGGSYGKTTVQSSTFDVAFADSNHHNTKYRVFDVMLGVINVTSADSIDFIENKIKHIGNEGISLINDVSNCTILGNSITDIGGSGIQVGHPQHLYIGDGGEHEKYSPSVEGVCKNNTISNNYIFDTTNMYLAHQAITAYFVDTLKIIHNHIESTNYGAVSVGWGWCNFDEVAVPNNPTKSCRNNTFNYNRVIECMKTLHDSGAFYTIGAQPNSEASYNYVKASTTHFQGVYHPDEGTAGYTGKDLVFEIVPGQDNFELNDWGRKHDNHYDNIYSTSSSQQTGAPNCSITNLHVYPNANWPAEALAIINNAGLEPEYQHMLPGQGTPTPVPTPVVTREPQNDPIFSGGPYSLNGTDEYGDLPGGMLTDVGDFTIACRVKLNNLTDWVRIFDFGSGTNSFMMLTPQSGTTGYPYFTITISSTEGEQGINANSALPTGAWQHLAVSKQGSTGILYINGEEAGRNNNVSLSPSDLGFTTFNFIGRSQWSHDPYLNAEIEEFFIYNRHLSASEIRDLALGNNTHASGDVNDDGVVNIVDALLIAQRYVNLPVSGIFIEEKADVNCSQKIDIVDALLVAQYYVGLIDEFSCE